MKSPRQHAQSILMMSPDDRDEALNRVPHDEHYHTSLLLGDWLWKWSLKTFRETYAKKVTREKELDERQRMMAMIPPEWKSEVENMVRDMWRRRAV